MFKVYNSQLKDYNLGLKKQSNNKVYNKDLILKIKKEATRIQVHICLQMTVMMILRLDIIQIYRHKG